MRDKAMGCSVLAYEEPELKYGGLLNELHLDFAAHSENVALARSLVAALIANCQQAEWDITLSALEEIKVAVSEAVSNAIIHGYQGEPGRSVHMELLLYQYALQVKVCDDGVGIADVQQAMEPEFTTGEEHLGLGFAFMSSFMDDVQVDSRLGCGTTVTMLKRIHQ